MKLGLPLPLLLLAFACAACRPAKETAASSTPAPATPAPAPALAAPPPNLRFKAYDGDPKVTDPKKMSFQIDVLDRRQPSEFLQIGDLVPNTKFRVTAFHYKTRHNTRTNEEDDASELTLTNVETNQTVVLTFPTVTDSPPVF